MSAKEHGMRGPLLKIRRAEYHIDKLEDRFAAYVQANHKAMAGEFDAMTGDFRQARACLPLPDDTALIIGDAVHNLRVSLDHAYWVMVENNGGTWGDRIKFPFGKDRPSVEGSVNGQIATSRPSQEVLDYIFGNLEPFPGGKLSLYDLHRLDITDKHQLLLPTSVGLILTATDCLIMTDLVGGNDITLSGPETGTSQLVMSAQDPVFCSLRGPIRYTGNLEQSMSVLFGEGPLGNNGVIETLRSLQKNCYNAVIDLGRLMK